MNCPMNKIWPTQHTRSLKEMSLAQKHRQTVAAVEGVRVEF